MFSAEQEEKMEGGGVSSLPKHECYLSAVLREESKCRIFLGQTRKANWCFLVFQWLTSEQNYMWRDRVFRQWVLWVFGKWKHSSWGAVEKRSFDRKDLGGDWSGGHTEVSCGPETCHVRRPDLSVHLRMIILMIEKTRSPSWQTFPWRERVAFLKFSCPYLLVLIDDCRMGGVGKSEKNLV